MGYTRKGDSGASWAQTPKAFRQKPQADRDTQKGIADRLTAELEALDKQLVDARTELRMQAALAQAAADDLSAPAPTPALLHALHAPGRSGVWVDGVLVLVVGSARSDERAERALARYVRGEGEVAPLIALCGFWAQHMPDRLLGYVRDGRIIVNRALSRQERGQVRRELAAKVRARRQARRGGWRLTVLAPVALLLATLRSLLYGLRDVAVTVGPTLATATATVTIVATVTPSQVPMTFSPSGGGSGQRRGAITVAQNMPLASAPARTSPSPRPSSTAETTVPAVEALPAPLPIPAPVPTDPVPTVPLPTDPVPTVPVPTTVQTPPVVAVPTPEPSVTPTDPTPTDPAPSPSIEVAPQPTPIDTPPAEPAPTEQPSPPPAVTSDPPADTPPAEPPADPTTQGGPGPFEPADIPEAACLISLPIDGCTAD